MSELPFAVCAVEKAGEERCEDTELFHGEVSFSVLYSCFSLTVATV